MKKRLSILGAVVCLLVVSSFQTKGQHCGSPEYLKNQMDKDPNLASSMMLAEKQLQKWINESYNPNSKTVITIPVVVHIVYYSAEENLSDSRVQEQIDALNMNFAGLNLHSMEAFSTSLKSNTGIQFCLAQRKPDGSATNGIERRYNAVDTVFQSINDGVKFYLSGGLDSWDATKYFNIWVCDLAGFIVGGYGTFPTTINNKYGAVLAYRGFGVTGAYPNYNEGALATHEIGHCFNLWHTWGDDNGACTGTDYCGDTPNEADRISHYQTGVVTDACSPSAPGVMYMNFMDNTYDNVKTNFTPNQTARIQACFANNGPLKSLLNSSGCVAPPIICSIPTSLGATSITSTSATLTWGAVSGAVSYNVKYKKVSANKWTSTTSATNSKAISGLSAGTAYEFQVQTVCSSGSSAFSSSFGFTTLLSSGKETSSVDNFLKSTEFSIIPNPAKDKAIINFEIDKSIAINIKLFDISGRLICSNVYLAQMGLNNYTLDLNMIKGGIYFVELSVEGQFKNMKKLIVNK